MNRKVCAVIVTRNRVNTLRRAVDAVRSQSYPVGRIIIVDNDSTDSTADYLQSLASDSAIRFLRQQNLGGAGGFNKGLELFLETDYEWAWLMDDDGRPDIGALRALEPNCTEAPLWRNSLVVDEIDHNMLAYGFSHHGAPIQAVTEALSCEPLISECNPFNGTLLHRSLIRKIGLPIGQLFIKGDETEFLRRARRFGYVTATYPESIFFHPSWRESNICDIEPSRSWVLFYKVRNLDVTGEPDGKYQYNAKSSLRCAKRLTTEIVVCCRRRTISLRRASVLILLIWSGFIAARINLRLNLFVPK